MSFTADRKRIDMTKFRILAATDGSPSARAALKTAVAFPWPEPSRARGVVALGSTTRARGAVRAAVTRGLYGQVDPARRLLAQRWADADVIALHEAPAKAIFSEARRFGADAFVLGWRGHGALRRLLAGSVTREVVARATRPVLVARTAARTVRRLVVGFDGSGEARRAVLFLRRLKCPRDGSVVLVNIAAPVQFPPAGRRLPASLRRTIDADVAKANAEREAQAQRKLKPATSLLKRAGWHAQAEIRFGAPLEGLLAAAAERKGDVLVVGARATRGLQGLLLGSVATGALNHSRIPVLIVP
jgi:nucleotide-binding universal stress UspA family protein